MESVDFTGLTAVVDPAPITAGILSIAAGLAVVLAVRKGARLILSMMR